MDNTKKLKYQKELDYTVSKIRELRKARGWTVQELAYKTDMERSSLSRIESGRSNISFETLYKIADALGVAPKSLLPR